MIENTKKRLREAQYFYRQLIEITRRPTTLMNEPEAFEFNLNACLTAARSVSWTLENEEKAKYEAWHSSWESGLSPNDRALLKFTNEQRIAIVKRGGTEAKSEDRYVPITDLRLGSHGHPAFQTYVSALPGTTRSQPQIEWKELYFELEGERVSAMELCRRYLDYLHRFVRAFIDDHKEPA